MEHVEYVHEVKDSQTVVVFIHGILGTPHHFDSLIPYVPKEWSIHNMLLDGHGKTVDDFAKTSMKKWKQQVHERLLDLSQRYEHILIVAHSMGTLFALQEAMCIKQIQRLFLLAVPLNIFVQPKMLAILYKIMSHKVKDDDVWTLAAQQSNSISLDAPLWKYCKWIPNYLALLLESQRTKKQIQKLTIPCVVFQSKKDELVAKSTMNDLQSEWVEQHWLEHSGHFYYEAADLKRMIQRFVQFCSVDFLHEKSIK